MRADPFAFFRATAHLFWEDWRAARAGLADAPLVWCCGDLHLENFGSYRGDNGLAYFDLNDFDDAALAPATYELARMLTSIRLAASSLSLDGPATAKLESAFLDAYAGALADGKARWIERAVATGIVRDLLQSVKQRTRKQLLGARTAVRGGRPRLRNDERAYALSPAKKRRVRDCVKAFAAGQPDPGFYRVLDVAGRVAGKGSLGLERYVVLVRGPKGTQRERLLDLKEAHGSALEMHLPSPLATRQPRWRNEAERVVTIQRRMQAIPPALLAATRIGRTHFILRELQPTEDRLTLGGSNRRLSLLDPAVRNMGELTAWAQLRSAARDGASSIDALIAFSRDRGARRRLRTFARRYAAQVKRDWRAFRDSPPQ